MQQSLILKSKSWFAQSLPKVQFFLNQLSENNFWRSHFKNTKSSLNFKKFSWDKWQTLPFITKEEYLKIGFGKRFEGAKRIIDKRPLRFILQSTSGTSKTTEAALFVKNVDLMVEGPMHGEGDKMLILYQPRAISLRDTIALITQSRTRKKPIQSLVVNPFKYTNSMTSAILQFKPDSTVTFPACISFLASLYPDTKHFLIKIKKIWLSGDFISNKQQDFFSIQMPRGKFNLDYITSEVDTIGMCCKYLKSRLGTNVYHPFDERIIELINIDENGLGEVVVTKMFPQELGFVRYRTGDLARAINEKCKCGNEWTLLLQGRRNMDYIKQLGVLITRQEIERVLSYFEKLIEDWRGEVREVDVKGALLGELTLLFKLKKPLSQTDIKILEEKISDKLFLTPNKTLSQLAKEKKFLPLKIKIVDEFILTSKKVPLRKILD